MMDKQYAIAVMTIILGLGVNQAGNSDAIPNPLRNASELELWGWDWYG